MAHQGFIKLHRKITDSVIWGDPYYLKLWIFCLMEATHKEREQLVGNKIEKLNPGQFIIGRKVLTEKMNCEVKRNQKLSEKTWWRYLLAIEKLEMLTIKKTTKYSVVTVVEWNKYQQNDQQVSNNCPTDDQQVTTNKNVKNVKNVKKKDRPLVGEDQNTTTNTTPDLFDPRVLLEA